MKQFIQTQIRHLITLLAGLITALVQWGLVSGSEAEEVVAKVDGFSDFIAPIVAAFVMRSIMLLAVRLEAPAWFKDLFKVTPLLLVCMITAVGAGLCLPSCSSSSFPSDGLNYNGSVYYRHDSGAKAGLNVGSDGDANVFLRFPWFDRDTIDDQEDDTHPVTMAK